MFSGEDVAITGRPRAVAAARRSRLEIWADILAALPRDTPARRDAVPTRVQSAANLPHNRFWQHVHEMEARGLLTTSPLAVTPLGREFLDEAASVDRFLRRFRLDDAPAPPR